LEVLPRADLVARCTIRQRSDPAYVPSGCLLYFVRASRADNSDAHFERLYKILDLSYWWAAKATLTGPGDRPVAFTSNMTAELGRLSALVIAASGTGSIVGEQLARLGFGGCQWSTSIGSR
jgi:hypothetical protein